MDGFSLHIPVPLCRCENSQRKAEYLRCLDLANKMEVYLSKCMVDRKSLIVSYADIAQAMGCDQKTVYELLATVGGGEKAITLTR